MRHLLSCSISNAICDVPLRRIVITASITGGLLPLVTPLLGFVLDALLYFDDAVAWGLLCGTLTLTRALYLHSDEDRNVAFQTLDLYARLVLASLTMTMSALAAIVFWCWWGDGALPSPFLVSQAFVVGVVMTISVWIFLYHLDVVEAKAQKFWSEEVEPFLSQADLSHAIQGVLFATALFAFAGPKLLDSFLSSVGFAPSQSVVVVIAVVTTLCIPYQIWVFCRSSERPPYCYRMGRKW